MDLDGLRIHDLLQGYAFGVDRRDFDRVAACFVPGARYEGSLARTVIEDALQELRQRLERYVLTMHFLSPPWIFADAHLARAETDCVAYHLGAAEDLIVAVRYEDELIRTAAGFRICARRARKLWTTKRPPTLTEASV